MLTYSIIWKQICIITTLYMLEVISSIHWFNYRDFLNMVLKLSLFWKCICWWYGFSNSYAKWYCSILFHTRNYARVRDVILKIIVFWNNSFDTCSLMNVSHHVPLNESGRIHLWFWRFVAIVCHLVTTSYIVCSEACIKGAPTFKRTSTEKVRNAKTNMGSIMASLSIYAHLRN